MDKIFIFLLGAATGSVVTYKLVEKKFKDIADEEIESVKERFKNKEKDLEQSKEVNEYKEYKNIIKEYSTNAAEGFSKTGTKLEGLKKPDLDKMVNIKNLVNKSIAKKDEESKKEPNIEIISEEDFGDTEGYDEAYWILYNNNILVDDFNKVVDNREIYIGDFTKELQDDQETIFIRNNDTCIDYEILKVDEDWVE